jgi:amylosucrase
VQVTASGMALSGKAIEGTAEIMKYFGEGRYLAKECDFAYNSTQMALQWDALASGRVSMMMAAQTVLAEKPYGTTWITYTRNHNDISLDFDDSMILESGFTPHAHREYLKEFFSGTFPGSTASGAIFHANDGTPEARISGTLASLCGLEKAIKEKNEHQISISIQKILLMQANSCFAGGMPMLFYGDETGYLNDYSFQKTDKTHDNRWMHKPLIDWEKIKLARQEGTIENRIYSGTKKLLSIRTKLAVVADVNNTRWLPRHNIHIAGFVRNGREKALFCIFNYSNESAYLTWHSFRYNGFQPQKLYDHWSDNYFEPGNDADFLILEPYAFYLLEVIS